MDIGEFLYETFPKYTKEMYEGNAPACRGHKLVSGGYADKWGCKYGGGETIEDKILYFDFSLNHKVNIYIVGDILNIVDHRYSWKFDEWCYCNKPEKGRIHGCAKHNMHELEDERIEKYLNTDMPNCKAWDIVQARAKELYYQEKENRSEKR